MTKKLLLCASLAAILLSGCESFYINDGCTAGVYCDETGAIYECIYPTNEDGDGKNLDYKNLDYSDLGTKEPTIWRKTEKKCLYNSSENDDYPNGCMVDKQVFSNSKCACNPECPNNCDITGACCKFGFDEDGSCSPCLNGYDEDGSCLCSAPCLNGCNLDGTCKCSDKCKAGCYNDGSCKCPESCASGCNDDGSCIKAENCLNGINDNGACFCPTECTNGCEANGACKCAISCSNGCDVTGQTCCKETCQNGCNSGGSCLCPKGCTNGCDISGDACCDIKCQHGCELDGTCSCPGNCVNGCNDDGTCKPSENCKNGIDENGACKCPDACQNGCNENGEICTCPFLCESGCDKTGAKCTCTASCVTGSACDENTGKCTCIEKCKNGCDETGTCDAACEDVECKGENEQCQKGKCIDLCKDITCENADEYCKRGKCMPIDANQNHMHDKYETAPKQGNACRKHADCNASNIPDGFCDSFIGYRCSTKCTADEQCLSDNEYTYICRPDGRCAPDSFVTVWNIPKDTELFLSTNRVDYANFTIDWGDGKQEKFACSKELNNCEDISHKYNKKNTYTVIIKGTLDGFGWSNYSFAPYSPQFYQSKQDDDVSPTYLVEVKAFGPVGLGSYAFAFCENLKRLSKIDIPDASKLKTLERAFAYAGNFNLPLEHWDVSQVTDMSAAFRDDAHFNQPLDHWDTSNVTKLGGKETNYNGGFGFDYSGVFHDAAAFDQPLSHWDTSKVTTMANMFMRAKSFNQPLNDWDTSNVTTMADMFYGAESFNQPLNKWNTNSLIYIIDMFYNAKMFNQDISMWNVSNIKRDTSSIFKGSGISKSNYCKIVETWNIGSLGNYYNCTD